MNLFQYSTQGSQTRTFTYDSLSRLRTATNPESGTVSYQYDDNSNLLVKTEARSVSAHFEYDSLNRVTRRWYNGSNSVNETTHNSPVLPTDVVPGGSVTGNNKIWRKITFSPITTRKLPVLSNASPDGVSRLTEIEAYGPMESTGSGGVNWLITDHLGTPRMVLDQTGSLAGMTRHDYLPFGEELVAPAGGDGVRQQFTQKERDVETGLDYFLARYYSPAQGRFTGADNPGFSNGTDPQTWNLYAYTANNPLRRVDPDGRDWFQIGDGYGARFEWHEGKKYKYKDEDGNEKTAKNVGTHLLVFEFSRNEDGSIRRNSDGAAIGTLTLYNQNRVVAENTEAFTGGTGYDDMPVGVFTIRTDIRERASNETALKPDNPRELKQIYGLQEIDRSLGFAGPWGSRRAALNEWDSNLPKLYRGNFLHGRERTTSVTAGCYL